MTSVLALIAPSARYTPWPSLSQSVSLERFLIRHEAPRSNLLRRSSHWSAL